MLIDKKEKRKFSRFTTEQVLQTWASQGEMNVESLERAASSYARLEVSNRVLRYVLLVIMVFLLIFLGMMIASVVIGVTITKDVKVKDGQLVSFRGQASVVKTSEALATNKITLQTPLSVIQSTKTLTVSYTEDLQQGVFKFQVVSFYYVPGRKLVFFGHSHLANVMPDGSIELTLYNPSSTKRDTVPAISSADSAVSESSGLDDTIANVVYTDISTCEQLKQIQSGNYALRANLECTLDKPLLQGSVFTGIFNGFGFYLSITMNRCDSVALFDTVQATFVNFNLRGSFSGCGNAAAVAVTARPGTRVINSKSQATITCQDKAGSSVSAAACFISTLENPTNSATGVLLEGNLSNCTISVSGQAYALMSGLYARQPNPRALKVEYSSNIFAGEYSATNTRQNSTLYGFLVAESGARADVREILSLNSDCPDNYQNITVCVNAKNTYDFETYYLCGCDSVDLCGWICASTTTIETRASCLNTCRTTGISKRDGAVVLNAEVTLPNIQMC